MKGARWALLKNESDLNAAQRARLEYVANTNETLWTAYKLEERLGMILRQGRGRIPVRHRGILKTRREDRTAPLRHPITRW
ncbi:transposase [Bifidobacterium breve]|uniref:transposase n=1 Tax=Bifidobacterium breve TaxID=1685 RepID=UPI003DA2AF75